MAFETYPFSFSRTMKDWRDVPLLTALSYGVASVEADVSLINGTLYVSRYQSDCQPSSIL